MFAKEQIAFGPGFKDPDYFNRFFKKHVGIPPGTHRRRMRGRRSCADNSCAVWP